MNKYSFTAFRTRDSKQQWQRLPATDNPRTYLKPFQGAHGSHTLVEQLVEHCAWVGLARVELHLKTHWWSQM